MASTPSNPERRARRRDRDRPQTLCHIGKSLLAYNRSPLSDVFHALAAPARRAILDELHERDGQTLFELCTRLTMKHELGMSRQAISQHLDVLEAAGLVSSRREGRYKFHYLDATPLEDIARRWSIEDGNRRPKR
jgi:DNA-binding transcriptional ArsR family regulator